ncbi:MAG: LacI family transcriptional regulator [Kiritimatiellales bacterium]|nr:LacI family transcriptional regulator [Kiritimatiellales bacterium]
MSNGQTGIPATIRDVAKEVGCSIATVSSVLNGRGRISDATKEKVREACKKLGYFPNAAGRNLRNRTTENIGILFYPSCARIFSNIFYSEMMAGLEEELTKANYNLLLAGYDISTNSSDLPKFIREGSVDGVIMLGGCPDEFKQQLADVPLPFLLLDTNLEGMPVDSIITDGFQAELMAVDYLVKQGHRRIVMFRHRHENYNEEERGKGFLAGAKRHGLENEADVIRVATNDEAVEKIKELMKDETPVTAITAVNDDMAVDIMHRLQLDGINVPDDISIIGFDDIKLARDAIPPLTTIAIDKKRIGKEGAETILSRIKDPGQPTRKIMIPTSLVVRESVKSL